MIIIREMRESDVDGVMVIENDVVAFPWTPNIFSDCIKVGYSCWVFAEGEENKGQSKDLDTAQKIVGYSLMSMSGSEAHILNICIQRDKHRQGLGLRMMLHLIEEAKRIGAESVFLEVRPSNYGAFRLYKNLGFKIVGRRKDYYPDPGGREDALVLEMNLR